MVLTKEQCNEALNTEITLGQIIGKNINHKITYKISDQCYYVFKNGNVIVCTYSQEKALDFFNNL